ncbi:serine/threonine-protein kinase [Streptomyces sp. NPDC004291]
MDSASGKPKDHERRAEGSVSDAEPGRVIGGRYRLVRTLGGGGFGRVWKAVDESLRVDVALKEVWLPPASSSAEHDKRLAYAVREARNAARLRDHPHIVAVHDVVVENGIPWTVMRLVDGESLEQSLAVGGPLPPDEATALATALLKALKAAHDAGIVHRDIKPANVMVTAAGEVLLTDFGISVHHADTALTTTGSVIGSAEYMAPERLNGVDGPAGDLFSLGALLYQTAEGVSPFRRDTPTATLAAVALHEVSPPRHAGDLATLITALLAKQPAERPSAESALEMLRHMTSKPLPRPDGNEVLTGREPREASDLERWLDRRDLESREGKTRSREEGRHESVELDLFGAMFSFVSGAFFAMVSVLAPIQEEWVVAPQDSLQAARFNAVAMNALYSVLMGGGGIGGVLLALTAGPRPLAFLKGRMGIKWVVGISCVAGLVLFGARAQLFWEQASSDLTP